MALRGSPVYSVNFVPRPSTNWSESNAISLTWNHRRAMHEIEYGDCNNASTVSSVEIFKCGLDAYWFSVRHSIPWLLFSTVATGVASLMKSIECPPRCNQLIVARLNSRLWHRIDLSGSMRNSEPKRTSSDILKRTYDALECLYLWSI